MKNIKIMLGIVPMLLGVTLSGVGLVSCNNTHTETTTTSYSLALKSGKSEVEVGSTDEIVIKDLTPSDSKVEYEYTSSDSTILEVSSSGVLTAKKYGEATISVVEKNSKVTKTIVIKVTEGSEDFSLISPAGAPTLAIYDTIASKDGAETTSQVTQIPLYLQSGDKYNYVIFDSINALKLTNNAKKAGYTYQMMLTGGNFHLAGFNKTTEPKVGDKIVTFGESLIPDLAFKTCYPDLFVDSNLSNISYVSSVSDVTPILKSGLYQGSKVDYCFIAQPALFSAMSANNKDDNTQNDITDIVNLNTKISEITNGEFNYIPQAALFVKDSYLASKPHYVSEFLADVKSQMKNALGADLDAVKASMEKVSTDSTKQIAKYGFNETIAVNLQKDNKNQFGIMDPDKPVTIDNINTFLTDINAGFKINAK